MGRTECSTDTFRDFSVTCDLFGIIQEQSHRKEICCPGYMFFLQRNLGPCPKGTLFQKSELFSDSPISSQIKRESYSQLCIIALWDLIHTREPVSFYKQRCIEMNSSSQNAPNNRVIWKWWIISSTYEDVNLFCVSTGVHWATASLFCGIWNNKWLWNEITLELSCCLRGNWIASC